MCPIFPPQPKNVGSGVTQVVYILSKDLVQHGNEVEVYTSDALDAETRIGTKANFMLVDGIKVDYFHYIMHYYTFFLTPSIISTAKGHLKEFDIIHIHDYMSFQGIVVAYFARKFNIKYVVQAHGSLADTTYGRLRSLLKNTLFLMFGLKCVKGASMVIALNQFEAKQYRFNDVPAHKIAIIPNGLDVSRYANLPSKGVFRKKFGISCAEKIVLYLGRIHRIKGIDVLVRAFEGVYKKMESVRLVIVGPDDGYISELEALIKTLKVENRVLVLGPLYGKDKLAAYVDADFYVQPSRYETFPMTVLEAYACGKPVIASKVGGLENLVINGKTGLLVDPENADILAKSILCLLTDVGKATEMGLKGKQFVMENFTVEKVVDRLQSLYREVASSASAEFTENTTLGLKECID